MPAVDVLLGLNTLQALLPASHVAVFAPADQLQAAPEMAAVGKQSRVSALGIAGR